MPRVKGVGRRIVLDDLQTLERVVRVGANERVCYLIPVLDGFLEPRRRQIVLAGEGAQLEVYGVFVGHGSANLKLTFDTIHAAAHTRSRTLFKGVLAGTSTFDVNGVIRITKDGHGSDAFLEERALLLSPNALANTIPSLEIEANDVKCKHAATAGPVDQEQLFYLRSRGLDERTAETLIVRGFLEHVLRQLDPVWRKRILEVVGSSL